MTLNCYSANETQQIILGRTVGLQAACVIRDISFTLAVAVNGDAANKHDDETHNASPQEAESRQSAHAERYLYNK